MALKAVAGGSGGGGELVGSTGSINVQLSNGTAANVNGKYFIAITAPFDMTLNEAVVSLDSGSFDMEIFIDVTSVTGSQQSVTVPDIFALTANNSLPAGNECTLVITNSSSPVNAAVQIMFTRESV